MVVMLDKRKKIKGEQSPAHMGSVEIDLHVGYPRDKDQQGMVRGENHA